MKFHNKQLNLLAHNQTKVLVFDCEFWHVLSDDKKYNFLDDADFFFVPREIGGFILEKSKDEWSYNGSFFWTFSKPKYDVAFPISHFSTVTPETGYKLDELEQKLGIGWGVAYPSRLSDEGKRIHKEGIRAYESDANIKKHHKTPAWFVGFMKQYSESMIVVKGTSDIDALKNAAMYYGFEYKDPLEIVDIADWNPQSYKKCRTAKLAGTFDCIKHKLDNETKHLADYLPLEKAHDPSTDASMTLLVALYIQSQHP